MTPADPRDRWARALPQTDVVLTFVCPMEWNEMHAVADGVRWCGRCNLHVYALGERSDAELRALFDAHGGRICGRASVRSDGTLARGECPETVEVLGRMMRVDETAKSEAAHAEERGQAREGTPSG